MNIRKLDDAGELISIIVPVYNKEVYLEECIQSLLDQSYKNIEVILIDDGSTDCSARICQSFCEQDIRVKSYFQKNSGQNAARKKGISKATGNWVLFVDADDFVACDYCLHLVEAQQSSGADIVMGKSQKYLDGKFGAVSGSLVGLYSGYEAVRHFIDRDFFSFDMPSGMLPILFKKTVIGDALHAIDLRITFSEDCGCTLYALLQAKKVQIISDVGYYYRQVPESYCHVHDKSNVFSQKLLIDFLYKIFLEHNMLQENLRIIHWLIIRDLLLGGYEFFLDYAGIFPFSKGVVSGKIALYGAGVFGEEIYNKLGRKFEIIRWVDREFQYYQERGKDVWDPAILPEMEFDWLIVAITHPKTARKVVLNLQDMGLDPAKILTISPAIIDSDYTNYKLKELRCADENYSYVPTTISSSKGK